MYRLIRVLFCSLVSGDVCVCVCGVARRRGEKDILRDCWRGQGPDEYRGCTLVTFFSDHALGIRELGCLSARPAGAGVCLVCFRNSELEVGRKQSQKHMEDSENHIKKPRRACGGLGVCCACVVASKGGSERAST